MIRGRLSNEYGQRSEVAQKNYKNQAGYATKFDRLMAEAAKIRTEEALRTLLQGATYY
jgi:hypothetical protein